MLGRLSGTVRLKEDAMTHPHRGGRERERERSEAGQRRERGEARGASAALSELKATQGGLAEVRGKLVLCGAREQRPASTLRSFRQIGVLHGDDVRVLHTLQNGGAGIRVAARIDEEGSRGLPTP